MDSSFDRKDRKEDWLTPPYIIKALGEFDLDPCSPINRPYDTAKKHYNKIDDGLKQEWEGRVYCNPPYGKETGKWIKRLKEHGNGIALIFARTETKVWHEHIWYDADAVFFFKGRIKFYTIEGKQSGAAGAPSALVAYGEENVEAIANSKLKGVLVRLKK
jgi:hypothetical protein